MGQMYTMTFKFPLTDKTTAIVPLTALALSPDDAKLAGFAYLDRVMMENGYYRNCVVLMREPAQTDKPRGVFVDDPNLKLHCEALDDIARVLSKAERGSRAEELSRLIEHLDSYALPLLGRRTAQLLKNVEALMKCGAKAVRRYE